MNLTWDDVDFVNQRIVLHTTKNKRDGRFTLPGKPLDCCKT